MVEASHIKLDSEGVAWIDDTNTKVIEVALDSLAHGWSAEEIHVQHRHLSLAQIHAALSYYHDHQHALNSEIDRRHARADALRVGSPRQPERDELQRRTKARRGDHAA
jgi:uncharacterized protein (DUF433 family)